jgi:hypothetical protein
VTNGTDTEGVCVRGHTCAGVMAASTSSARRPAQVNKEFATPWKVDVSTGTTGSEGTCVVATHAGTASTHDQAGDPCAQGTAAGVCSQSTPPGPSGNR